MKGAFRVVGPFLFAYFPKNANITIVNINNMTITLYGSILNLAI